MFAFGWWIRNHNYEVDVYTAADAIAEEVAREKMQAFGFEFENLSSSVEIRTPYTFSYVNIGGELANKDGRYARVRVLTRLDDCTYSSTSITHIDID